MCIQRDGRSSEVEDDEGDGGDDKAACLEYLSTDLVLQNVHKNIQKANLSPDFLK